MPRGNDECQWMFPFTLASEGDVFLMGYSMYTTSVPMLPMVLLGCMFDAMDAGHCAMVHELWKVRSVRSMFHTFKLRKECLFYDQMVYHSQHSPYVNMKQLVTRMLTDVNISLALHIPPMEVLHYNRTKTFEENLHDACVTGDVQFLITVMRRAHQDAPHLTPERIRQMVLRTACENEHLFCVGVGMQHKRDYLEALSIGKHRRMWRMVMALVQIEVWSRFCEHEEVVGILNLLKQCL